MTLKEFLNENNVTSFEVIENVLILNVFVDGEVVYGLDSDTSNIESGTILINHEDFTLVNDILTVGGVSVDANQINILN